MARFQDSSMVDKSADRLKGQSIVFLHLYALCSFAFAQPIYDLLARYPEFLVTHQAGLLDVTLLIVFLTLLLPLPFAGLVAVAQRHVTGRWIYGAVFTGMITLIFLPALKLSSDWSSQTIVLSAFVLAVTGTIFYLKSSTVRFFMTLLSPAIVIFPVMFLLSPGILNSVSTGTEETIETVTIKGTAPVVLVVLDELPLISLLDREQQIDQVRYPSFANLASRSIWFRNATTSAESTLQALPALLTGKYPEPSKLATQSDYPNNIFTALGGSYKINAYESHTLMCPEFLCGSNRQTFARRFPLLLRDLVIVYFHLVLPESITEEFPPINQGWKDFVIKTKLQNEQSSPLDRIRNRASRASADKPGQFLAFIESIQPSERPSFNFIHLLLPHVPWDYYPSGSRYNSPTQIPGQVPNSEKWVNDDWPVVQAYQRHLLQLGLVDKLLGQLITHLESTNMYDSSMIIVLADHGARFWPGESRRDLGSKHPSDILHIPLFIKLPQQDQGVVSNQNIETIDIFPTVLDILKTSIPWSVDGQSAVDTSIEARGEKLVFTKAALETHVFPPNLGIDNASLQRKLALFGSDSGDLFNIGPHKQMIDQNIEAFGPIKPTPMELLVQKSEVIKSSDMAIIPAFVEGSLIARQVICSPVDLAIAVNGTIRAMTRTYKSNGNIAEFTAMLPEAALKEGSNKIEIYRVSEEHSENSIPSIHLASFGKSNIAPEDLDRLITPDKNQMLEVEANLVSGWVDQSTNESGKVTLSGWAANIKALEPAETIVITKDNKVIFEAPTGLKRADVARHFSSDRLMDSGWRASFPSSIMGNMDCSSLRVFGVSSNGIASELAYHKGYSWR